MNMVWQTEHGFHKKFTTPLAFEHEWSFHRDYPYATPRVVKLLPASLTIVTEVGEPAWNDGWIVDEVAEILSRLAADHVHHRDVHPGNLIVTELGVKLIDWETAVRSAGAPYDIYGPVDVPVPVQHGGLLPQWWGSNDPGSIRSLWGVNVPDWLLQEIED